MTTPEIKKLFWSIVDSCRICSKPRSVCFLDYQCILSKDEEFAHVIETIEREAYNEGLTAFAWWKDGVQQVGTCGTLLKDALRKNNTEGD